MKSLRQQAYEAAIDMELARRRRSRRFFIAKPRLERLLRLMVDRSANEEEAVADFDWLWGNMRQRFPDLPWDTPENMRGELT